jgi:serine/threonine/tyrosine-interacting protein
MSEFSRTSRAQPAAPYSSRPPSPPTVYIPGPPVHNAHNEMTVVPSYANVDPAQLTADDLAIITGGGQAQSVRDTATTWNYANRRTAQPVLDFLYLGPSGVARDRAWLRDHGITMLLAARDARMAEARLMAVDKVAQELGIHAAHVDVTGNQDLIAALPGVIRAINDHILAVYRSQALPAAPGEGGDVVVDWGAFKRAKVLVFCETGNERSATIVIAYLMTVFGMDMVHACQFVHYRRFCITMDEEMKWLLQTFEGILSAKRTVNQQHVQAAAHDASLGASRGHHSKRGYDEAVADDSDDEAAGSHNSSRDMDRYRDRAAFAPFVDPRDDMME